MCWDGGYECGTALMCKANTWNWLLLPGVSLMSQKKKEASVTPTQTNAHGEALCFMVKTWARDKTTKPVLNNGWRLAPFVGWRLVAVGGGWSLVAVGGSWRRLVVGGWRLVVCHLLKKYWAC